MNLRKRLLAMHLGSMAAELKAPVPKPKPLGPMPKTLSHFTTVEEWEQYHKEVKEAQEKFNAPF